MEEKKISIDLSKLLEDSGINFKENSSGELIMDSCYNCGRSKKLYVQKETGVFICFRCEEKGNAVKLIAKYLNISFKEASIKLFGKEGNISATRESVLQEEEEPLMLSLGGLLKKQEPLPGAIELAPEFETLTAEHGEAYKYLKGRGYSDEDISRLKLKILPFQSFNDAWKAIEQRLKKQFSGNELKEAIKKIAILNERIVFPLYVDSQIVGYVARDFTGTKQPKVLNSTGNFRSYYVWNFDNVLHSDELLIFEGTTSAVKGGINRSVALLGKAMTKGQARLLKRIKANKVYICLDVGTDKEVISIYEALSIYFPGKIYQLKLPPHIKNKNRVSENVVEKIRNDLDVEISLIKNNDIVHFPYEGKNSILKRFNIANKLPSDQKKFFLKKKLIEKNWTADEIVGLNTLLFDSEYLDAGDYTKEEVESFKNNSVKIKGGMELS